MKLLRWIGTWAALTFLMVAAGALLGAVLFPVIGALAGKASPSGALALAGARNLGFYALVWAPGTAIVLTVILEARRRRGRCAGG
jgi:hypothetical protein